MQLPTRTYLTTPPGQEPQTGGVTTDELYSPGVGLPVEPRVPGRLRKLWVLLVVIVVLAGTGFAAFQLLTAGQYQDPALSDSDGTGPSQDAGNVDDPTFEIPEDG